MPAPVGAVCSVAETGRGAGRGRAPQGARSFFGHPGQTGVISVAEVRLWGRRIGADSLSEGETGAAFPSDPAVLGSGIELAGCLSAVMRFRA